MDRRHLAADISLIGIRQHGSSIVQGLQRNKTLAVAKTEGAEGLTYQSDIGVFDHVPHFDLCVVRTFDTGYTDGYLRDKFVFSLLFQRFAPWNYRGQRVRVEQQLPDLFGRC